MLCNKFGIRQPRPRFHLFFLFSPIFFSVQVKLCVPSCVSQGRDTGEGGVEEKRQKKSQVLFQQKRGGGGGGSWSNRIFAPISPQLDIRFSLRTRYRLRVKLFFVTALPSLVSMVVSRWPLSGSPGLTDPSGSLLAGRKQRGVRWARQLQHHGH